MTEGKNLAEQLVQRDRDSNSAGKGELLAPYLGDLTENEKDQLNKYTKEKFKKADLASQQITSILLNLLFFLTR